MRTNDLFGLGSLPRSMVQTPIPYQRVGFSWAAVAAGVALATAISILFAEVGLAFNLGLVDSQSEVKTIGMVNAITWVIGGLLAVFAGAWVAGRVSTARTALGGGLHGLAVWATAAIVALVFAVSAAGILGSGMVLLVGKGLDTAGKAVTAVAPNWDAVRDQLQEAGVTQTEKDKSEETDVTNLSGDNRFVDSSRVLELAGRHFVLEGSTLAAGERAELVNLLADRLDISPEAAERTLVQWSNVWDASVQRFEQAKAEASEVADQARAYATAAAGWAAFAMLLGAIVAAFGGAYGTACALRRRTDDWHSDSTRVATDAPLVRDDVAPPPSIIPSSHLAGKSSKAPR